MKNELRETKFSKSEVIGMKDRLDDIKGAINLIQMSVMREINTILDGCKNKTLTFTDDEGDDNLCGDLHFGETNETLQIRNVFKKGAAIALTTDNGEEYYPWEVDIDFPILLDYMVKELERETNDAPMF